jgi:hypothetical protein
MLSIPGAPAVEQAAPLPPAGAAPAELARPRRRPGLLAIVAVLAALGVAAASTDENEPARVDEGDTTGEGGATTEAEQPEVFAVGDVVQLGDWQVRVHGVTDPVQSTNPIVTPAPGNRWVAVDVEVTNTGSEPQVVSSLGCFEIVDDQNRSYSLTITAEGGSSPPDGEVAPGASRRGTLTYEVPADAAGLHLTFQCELFSTGSATIALG